MGHFQVNFPEEIVHAGLLPFKVRGAPIEASIQTRALDRTARFSRLRSNLPRATLSLLRCSLHILFATPPAISGPCGDVMFPIHVRFCICQNPNSPHSVTYLRGEYGRLKRSIEEISGETITHDALRNSIAVFSRIAC